MIQRILSRLLALILLLGCTVSGAAAKGEESRSVAFGGILYPADAERISISGTVTDFDAFESFVAQFTSLQQVDMWDTLMPAEQCHRFAARFPEIKWGWTMVLKGKDHQHLIRTDYTSWSTLHNNTSTNHNSEDFSILKYCWNLMGLDIGHNAVTDLGFVRDLPNLRVLIAACNQISDLSPLAELEHLEYAELFKNQITDISPLSEMKYLLDLNLCFNSIGDLTPLKGLKTLQRLWLYSSQRYNTVPDAATVKELKTQLPDTLIDTTHYSTTGGWRTLSNNRNHPHYQAVIEMFGPDHLHPATEFVPFADSLVEAETAAADPAEAAEAPAKTFESAAQEEPPTEAEEPAEEEPIPPDYLLPIDFSAGSVPKASGYNELTYSDSTIRVTITTDYYEHCRYWVADIVLTDASQLRTIGASADGSFTKTGQLDPKTFAKRTHPVLAINGDYFSDAGRKGLGYVVRQGVEYRLSLTDPEGYKPRYMDILLIDEYGDFHIIRHADKNNFEAERAKIQPAILNAFSFGPALVDQGELIEDYGGTDSWVDMAQEWPKQRICICQAGKLHYKVICCAGRYHDSTGMTMKQFASLVGTQDVITAYNLDGGDSTWLYFNNTKVNEYGSFTKRKLADIIYFASAEE